MTPNHGHAAMMGVFGMLALALMVFVLRQTTDQARWPGVEKYICIGFWGTNIGLAMMVAMSLFPAGVLQVWDVVQHGYWHARSIAYTGGETARLLEWLRLPGDLVFIVFGAVPLTIAALKAYWSIIATRFEHDRRDTALGPLTATAQKLT
jgi:nitric oxide reductase subunit B